MYKLAFVNDNDMFMFVEALKMDNNEGFFGDTFDLNRDGIVDGFERAVEMEFILDLCDEDNENDDDDLDTFDDFD